MSQDQIQDHSTPHRRQHNATSLAPRMPKKTDDSLVVLDNPDDGEIYDTGDASDFAGEKKHRDRNHRDADRR